MYKIINGLAESELKNFPDNHFDALITDPPAGISFMGKEWDSLKGSPAKWIEWLSGIMQECYRILKPGAHGLVWALPKISHRTATACELAGFEVRDIVYHLFSSGFPKSMSIDKSIDLQEQKKWNNISKAIDKLSRDDIIKTWKEYLKNVDFVETLSLMIKNMEKKNIPNENFVQKNVPMLELKDQQLLNIQNGLSNVKYAEKTFIKNIIEIGMNIKEKDFVQENVMLITIPKKYYVSAIIAELNLKEVLLMQKERGFIVQESVDTNLKQSQKNVTPVGNLQLNQNQEQFMYIFIVQQNVWELLKENTKKIIKDVEALPIWSGKKEFWNSENINALYVELIKNLKHIMLSQSKTFQNYDTIQQMEFAFAMTAIITKSTMDSLILFMVDIVKKIAIDKQAGAKREIMGNSHNQCGKGWVNKGMAGYKENFNITIPATESAKQWEGWGTALKPCIEHWLLIRKPISEKNITDNVLKWGTGGINIDGCRIPTDEEIKTGFAAIKYSGGNQNTKGHINTKGRWPAQLIYDGSPEVMAEFEKYGESKSTGGTANRECSNRKIFNSEGCNTMFNYGDIGSIARFFYCAKPCSAERNEGLEGFPIIPGGSMLGIKDGSLEGKVLTHNMHPTVKSIMLMKYLITLVTPPCGKIIDPFAGSGTTGIAAELLGFDSVLIEKEKEYFEIIQYRLQHIDDYKEPELFDKKEIQEIIYKENNLFPTT